MGLPSIVIWRNGERMTHLSGESLAADDIRQALDAVLAGAA